VDATIPTKEAPRMKYALLIYSDSEPWAGLPEDEQQAVIGEYFAFARAAAVSGGAQLQPPELATTVRVEDGRTIATDGPFAETKEVIGGFFLVDADTVEDAVALAARIPAARLGGAVEVRPIVER
jgi:hypothetical protein